MNVTGRFEGPAEFNVLGEPLEPCSSDPLTGFFRTGYCAAGPDNAAHHLVCIEATAAFLDCRYFDSGSNATRMPQNVRNEATTSTGME